MESKKRYNTAVLLTYIASALTLLLAIISLIMIIPLNSYSEIFMSLKNNEVYGELIDLFISQGIDETYLSATLYIILIIFTVLSLLLAIPSLVFAVLNKNEKNLSLEDFQKNSKKHIWFLISIGLGYYSNSSNIVSSLIQEMSLLNTAATILYVIAFIFALITIINNRKALKNKEQEVNNNSNSDFYYNNYYDINNEDNISSNNNDNVSSNNDNNLNQNNQKVKVDPKELDRVYELLSKLEKEYKNGEIQEEDYKRMKETILKNYLDD